jgi:hypothetical protein
MTCFGVLRGDIDTFSSLKRTLTIEWYFEEDMCNFPTNFFFFFFLSFFWFFSKKFWNSNYLIPVCTLINKE